MARNKINQMFKAVTLFGGLLAVVLGLILILIPKLALATFVIIFAGYLILFGIVKLVDVSMTGDSVWSRVAWSIFGALAITGGIYLLLNPNISLAILAYGIGFYAVLLGISEMVVGLGYRQKASQMFWAIIRSVISIIFGVFLFVYPSVTLKYLVLFFGWYSLVYGVILIAYGLFVQADNQNKINKDE
jgi:hypothetical protein